MGESTPAVILDCDPGHEDVVAIVAAARHTELLGITTVAGNAPLDRTTYNARVMRDLLGLDVAIHSGAARPLVVAPAFAGYVHGESGLDGAELPEPTTALDGVDLDIELGQVFVLLGPSGCGKTTLLRCLAGLKIPVAGSIEIDGTPLSDAESGLFIPPEDRPLTMVFQSYAMWPHMSVFDNVAFPLKAGRRRLPQNIL